MTQVKPLEVVAIGEAMVEFNQQDPTHYLAGFGGDTSNCVIAAARMGAKTAYLTQLGDDVFGDDLLALWQREGVATQGVGRVAGGQTGLYFVTHGAQGHRFSYRRADTAASRMSPAMLPVDLIASARWLHCSGISQAISASACDTVLEAIARARAAGTRVSYDLNFRPSLWPAARAGDRAGHAGAVRPVLPEHRRSGGAHRPERAGRRDRLVARAGRLHGGAEARRPRQPGVDRRRHRARRAAPGPAGGCYRRRRLLCRCAAGAPRRR